MQRFDVIGWSLAAAVAVALGACGGSTGNTESGSEKEAQTSEDSRTESPDEESEKKSAEQSEETKSAEKSKEAKESGNLPLEATGPVATIDGNDITAEAYNDHIREKFGDRGRPLPRRIAKRMRDRTLKVMIEKWLIERELRKSKISISEKEVDREFASFKDRFPNDKAFRGFMEHRNLTRKSLRNKIRKDAKLKKLLEKRRGVDVTKKEARKYYESNKEEFREPEQVKARHILVEIPRDADEEARKKARKEAQRLADKARKSDADFGALAREHSDGPSAKKGGDLGYFTRDRMVEAFSKKAFSMKDGEISDPVKTKFGYHVIKREGYKPKRTEKFSAVKDDLMEELERKRFREAVQAFSKQLRDQAKIEKMPDNIRINAPEQGDRGSGSGGFGRDGVKLKGK